MNTQTVPTRRTATYEFSRRSFGSSPLVRKARDRRNAARMIDRVLDHVHASDLSPYVTPQELSALRNEEDGGCVGRIMNLLRAAGERRKEIVAYIVAESRLMDARMPDDPFAEVMDALHAEEAADCGDCIPQHDFLRNPNKHTARTLREKLEAQRDATDAAIDKLKQYEESVEAK